MTITEEQLRYALRTVRIWLIPDERPGRAYRGQVLHPDDVLSDILVAIAHQPEDQT